MEPVWGAKNLFRVLDIILLCHEIGEIWVNRILKEFPDWSGGITVAAIQTGLMLRLLAPCPRGAKRKPYLLTSAGKALADIALADIRKADFVLWMLQSMAKAMRKSWGKLVGVKDVEGFIRLYSQLWAWMVNKDG